MGEADGGMRLGSGAKVFVHQAFTCCPYAAIITAKIHEFFVQNGCVVSDHPREAALSVVNTCGFNASRAAQAVKTIGTIRHLAPASPIVVAGCLTRIERDRIAAALAGAAPSVLIGPNEHRLFDGLLAELVVPFAEVETNLYHERYSSRDPRLGLYQVLVSTGCQNQCRYCVIRQAKGDIRSKPLATIRAEVLRGFAAGHRDLFLVGDDIASWGADRGSDVGELLRALTALGTDQRFSAEAFEPFWLLGHLAAVLPSFATGRFAWIVVPVQAGSDRVLGAMGRRYTTAAARDLVRQLAGAAPEMLVSTDFIFGFADETRAEFEQSLELAHLFGYANFNEYEPRPGTPPLSVPPGEMDYRRAAVQEFLRRQGSQLEVLTRHRHVPCEARASGATTAVGPVAPSPWVVAHGAKLRPRFEAAGELAAGWAVREVRAEQHRLVLVVAHPAVDRPLEFMVTARQEDAPCVAFSAEYNLGLIWEDRGACALDAGQVQALAALEQRLGLRAKA